MCVLTVVALLACVVPLNAALVRIEFETSPIGREIAAAAREAGARPMVAIVGSSQTHTGIDALAIENALASSPGAPFVADVSAAGLHASAYPHVLRGLFSRAKVTTVVLELGHIVHDQYGGAWTVRNFVDDAGILAAYEASDTARAKELLALRADEARFPWLSTSRLLRVAYDGRRRDDRDVAERMRKSRGFSPYLTKKDPEDVVRTLEDEFRADQPSLVDSSPQTVFVAVAKICAEICREHGVRLVVLMQPVNRSLAPRIPVLRHFEATARRETLPALAALGIETLVPPDRFYDAALYYDHVHFDRHGAREFTDWLAGELAKRGR